jgi:hypothetical protein
MTHHRSWSNRANGQSRVPISGAQWGGADTPVYHKRLTLLNLRPNALQQFQRPLVPSGKVLDSRPIPA